jgi:hypothetical protein
MQVMFLLDNREYLVLNPEQLQLRQLSEGVAGLGVVMAVPATKEDGTQELNEDGTPKLLPVFRPIINYPINFQEVKKVEGQAVAPPVPVPQAQAPAPTPAAQAPQPAPAPPAPAAQAEAPAVNGEAKKAAKKRAK